MCVMESNLVETPFSFAMVKTALLHARKRRSLILHSYFPCIGPEIPFPLSPVFVCCKHSRVVAFLLLDAKFYIDSFVLKGKMLIHPRKSLIRSLVDVLCTPSNPLLSMLDT